jgi:hypothetical protein
MAIFGGPLCYAVVSTPQRVNVRALATLDRTAMFPAPFIGPTPITTVSFVAIGRSQTIAVASSYVVPSASWNTLAVAAAPDVLQIFSEVITVLRADDPA